MARNTSRKPLAAKKPGRSRVAEVAGRKVQTAKTAVVAAKPKVPTRTPAPVLKAAASKPVAGSRPVAASKPAVASKPVAVSAPVKAVAKAMPVKPVIVAKPAVTKARASESRRLEFPPPRPIPEAVPTNGKPRKNQAGLSLRELEHFRDLLLEKRRELVGDMYSMESEALRTSGGTNLSSLPLHMADMGTDNYEQEFTLGLVEKDRGLLREINTALAKVQNGTYGICEGTGKPISKPRLEAQPWARHSIEYARQMQRPLGIGMGRAG